MHPLAEQTRRASVSSPAPAEEEQWVSLCSLRVGDGLFGIETSKIREVLGRREVQRVPLAPSFIGGVVTYRGEVLTSVCFRALINLKPVDRQACVLVLDDAEKGENFGLCVDSVGGVVTVSRRMLAPNPSTLDERGKLLFDGAYRMPQGLMVQLDPQKLRPARLSASGLFRNALAAPEYERETTCAL